MWRTCVVCALASIVFATVYGCSDNRPKEEQLPLRLEELVVAFEGNPDRFVTLESELQSEANADASKFLQLATESPAARVRCGALSVLLQIPEMQTRAFEIGVQDRDPTVVDWAVAASDQIFAEATGAEADRLRAALLKARPGADRELASLAMRHLVGSDRARLLNVIVRRNPLQSAAVKEVFVLLAHSTEPNSKALRAELLLEMQSTLNRLHSVK